MYMIKIKHFHFSEYFPNLMHLQSYQNNFPPNTFVVHDRQYN